MKYLISSFFIFFSLNIYSQAILVNYTGEIKYRENSLSEWQLLTTTQNFKLIDGSALKTEKKSLAKIISGESVIWVFENTALEVETTSRYFRSFGVVYGKIKASVRKIGNNIFQFKTTSSIFKLKESDVMITSTIEGKSSIDVLFGEAKFQYKIPPKEGEKSIILTQGMNLTIEDIEKPYLLNLISKEKEAELSSLIEEKDTSIKQSIQRETLGRFMEYSNTLNSTLKKFVYKEKEADFESQRTLTDLHNNLVRIDQRLVRPDPRTIQLFNLIKRKGYKAYNYATSYSENKDGFKYNGNQINNRVDSFIITFNFNKELPSSVNEWQSFFSNTSINPQWATFTALTNLGDKTFFISKPYKYIQQRNELINNTEAVGVVQNSNERDNPVLISGVISKSSINDIVFLNIREENPSNPTGKLIRASDNTSIDGAIWAIKQTSPVNEFEYVDNFHFYQLKGEKYIIGDNSANGTLWFLQENYLISNAGEIKNKGEILESNKSISKILKENAIESIMYVKKGIDTPTNEDYFYPSNIDLILVGDLPFSIFSKISNGVDRWKN